MRQNEISVLRYWQKKYIFEGFLVALVLVAIFIVVNQVITYWGGLLILAIALTAIMVLMIRALREGLQNKAEMLIWEKYKQQLDGLEFDVGGGIATEILENQDVFAGKQARECFNVLKTADYSMEEDLFYTEHRLKWVTVRNTAFRGIVMRFRAAKLSENGASEGYLVRDNILIEGPLKGFLDRCEGLKGLAKILRLLHADKVQIVAENGEIYFWIKTPRRLFYQFSLFEEISPLPFLTRVQQFQQVAEMLNEAYN